MQVELHIRLMKVVLPTTHGPQQLKKPGDQTSAVRALMAIFRAPLANTG